jgi:hypothetical protein
MVKNKHMAKSISDAGWYQLIEMTKFKAEWNVGQGMPELTPVEMFVETSAKQDATDM